MSGCSTFIDEASHERLKTLADSINETARMARATLALLLATALYLGSTLLSSTDENLLLNAQVAVLQVGFGMALEQSYIFGPPIFLYLHLQGLFLLRVLYRKIQEFKKGQQLSGIPNSQRVLRQEYWNLLSAFAFVQLFRQGEQSGQGGQGGRFPYVSRLLVWISIEAIPLSLLFVVALSFVRYQCGWITNIHHAVFVLDLISVVLFNYLVFGKRLRSPWTLIRLALAGSITLLLLFQARPPSFDIQSIEMIAQTKAKQEDITARKIFDRVMKERRDLIWRTGDKKFWPSIWESMQGKGMNIIDVVLCEQLDLVCRYLNVRNLWLVSTPPADVFALKVDGPDAENFDFIQWSSLNKLSLAGRNLRFADFRRVKLQGANLEGAQLQGAHLEHANLQGADLSGAIMHGAFLLGAELQGAYFVETELRGANLHRAELLHAFMAKVKLQNASLVRAQLQRAVLLEAELQGTNMEDAQMDGV